MLKGIKSVIGYKSSEIQSLNQICVFVTFFYIHLSNNLFFPRCLHSSLRLTSTPNTVEFLLSSMTMWVGQWPCLLHVWFISFTFLRFYFFGFPFICWNIQVDDNIPLRVMLLLMDEVFDLKEKNQWLRRNIKNLLQQLIRATYGDTINRSEAQNTQCRLK